jgi:hypothetical protein
MSRHIDQTTYCRREAAECARRALEATLAEVREPYVNLEQGWLRLAPETNENEEASVESGHGHRLTSARGRT